MIPISLKEFITTGRFGPVKPGMTRPELRLILGPPDVYSNPEPETNALIWKYGDIEFHFTSKEQTADLFLIFSDSFTVPRGGEKIDLDPWMVSDDLTITQAKMTLKEIGLEFSIEETGDEPKLIIPTSGVTLYFAPEDEGSGLRAFCLRAFCLNF